MKKKKKRNEPRAGIMIDQATTVMFHCNNYQGSKAIIIFFLFYIKMYCILSFTQTSISHNKNIHV